MPLYRHSPIWFSVLLLILIAGFWPSYFSKIGSGTIHPAHHGHGIAMLLWVLLLIAQPILIQKRRFKWHRFVGRSTFLLAPVIVLSGIWVNVYFMEGREAPYSDGLLSIYWFGYFLVIGFAIIYGLAIANRSRVELHARYMAATALIFLIPGLGRAYDYWLEPLTGKALSFDVFLFAPLIIGIVLLLLDIRNRKPTTPYLVFNALYLGNILLWYLLPLLEPWKAFTAWTAGLWL